MEDGDRMGERKGRKRTKARNSEKMEGGREREVCRSAGAGVKVKIRTEEGECVRAHFEGAIKW